MSEPKITPIVRFAVERRITMGMAVPMLASRRFAPRPEESEEPTAGRNPGRISRAGFTLTVALARAVSAAVRTAGRVVHAALALPLAGFRVHRIAAVYDRQLVWVLRHPARTVAAALLLLLGSLALYPRLGRELVPELTQGEFFVGIELPPGTHLDVTERRMAALERFAQGLPGVDKIYAISGTSNEQGGTAGELRENIGQLNVTVAPPVSREREEALMARLRSALDAQDDVEYRFGRPTHFSFRTPIEVEIRGYILSLLDRLGSDLVARMRAIDGLTDVQSSTEGGNPELQIRFDRERLASFALTLGDVAGIVRSKVQGDIVSDIQREDRRRRSTA